MIVHPKFWCRLFGHTWHYRNWKGTIFGVQYHFVCVNCGQHFFTKDPDFFRKENIRRKDYGEDKST